MMCFSTGNRDMKDKPCSRLLCTAVTCSGACFDECGIQALVHHWQKCIATGGDYLKNSILYLRNCSIK